MLTFIFTIILLFHLKNCSHLGLNFTQNFYLFSPVGLIFSFVDVLKNHLKYLFLNFPHILSIIFSQFFFSFTFIEDSLKVYFFTKWNSIRSDHDFLSHFIKKEYFSFSLFFTNTPRNSMLLSFPLNLLYTHALHFTNSFLPYRLALQIDLCVYYATHIFIIYIWRRKNK